MNKFFAQLYDRKLIQTQYLFQKPEYVKRRWDTWRRMRLREGKRQERCPYWWTNRTTSPSTRQPQIPTPPRPHPARHAVDRGSWEASRTTWWWSLLCWGSSWGSWWGSGSVAPGRVTRWSCGWVRGIIIFTHLKLWLVSHNFKWVKNRITEIKTWPIIPTLLFTLIYR